MENDALKPEPTYKSVNCTTCYYNFIVGQTYWQSASTVLPFVLCDGCGRLPPFMSPVDTT